MKTKIAASILSLSLLLLISTQLITLVDPPTATAMLVESYGPYAMLVTINHSASVKYCFYLQHFQPPTVQTPLGGSIPNPRVGEEMPMTDKRACASSPFGVVVEMLRMSSSPSLPSLWPQPFIVSPQQ